MQVKCPKCGLKFEIDTDSIPVDAKFETPCPACGTYVLRRKIAEEDSIELDPKFFHKKE